MSGPDCTCMSVAWPMVGSLTQRKRCPRHEPVQTLPHNYSAVIAVIERMEMRAAELYRAAERVNADAGDPREADIHRARAVRDEQWAADLRVALRADCGPGVSC